MTAVGAATALAQVPGAGTNDYSSGFGFLEQAGTTGSVGYEVIAATPGGLGPAAQGELDFRRYSTGKGFHANAICIDAQGNTAIMAFQIEQTTDPANYRLGEFVEAIAQDGGYGNGGTRKPDRFHLDSSSSPTTVTNQPDCADSHQLSTIRGDIVIHDAPPPLV